MKTFDQEVEDYLIRLGITHADGNLDKYKRMITGFISDSESLQYRVWDSVLGAAINRIRYDRLDYDPTEPGGLQIAFIEYLTEWKAGNNMNLNKIINGSAKTL
jgi:hypothetical protein